MALTVETGSGVSGADSYVTLAALQAYWTNNPQRSESATFLAADEANQEGAAREASAFLDAIYGPHYKGWRKGYVQGLLWPRSGALDEEGYPLPDLPQEITKAVFELAGRAVSGSLSPDAPQGGRLTELSVKVGPVNRTQKFGGQPDPETKYGFVDRMIAPVLKGTQPNAPGNHWSWA